MKDDESTMKHIISMTFQNRFRLARSFFHLRMSAIFHNNNNNRQTTNGTQVKTFKQQTAAKVWKKVQDFFLKVQKKSEWPPKKNDIFQPKTKPSASPWRELLHHLCNLKGLLDEDRIHHVDDGKTDGATIDEEEKP